MPDAKATEKTEPKSAPKIVGTAAALTPAGEATDPAVHQLLAELETARANGESDDVDDIIGYLRELGYSAS